MRSWVAALVAAALAAGCNYGAGTFHCMADTQCGTSGMCEVEGLCSQPSGSCPSRRAYSDLSGAQSGQCVGGSLPSPDSGTIDAPPPSPPLDAGIDTPPPLDATACFGSGLVQVCLASPPAQPLTISTRTVIDTDDTSATSPCAPLISGGNYCVVAATVIMINADLRAGGTRPLVVLASDSLTVAAGASLDVGSHRAPPAGTPEIGAGSNPAAFCGSGTTPNNSGGGAGGSFTGSGGLGGNGSGAGSGKGVPAPVAGAVTELRGGCSGQKGSGGANAGEGGHGGGAVFLIATTRIDSAGAISAAGEGGGGGIRNSAGGGGGGAGGMIGFDAPIVTVSGTIVANGGGGGEGSGQTTLGRAGTDATMIVAAAGGAGNTTNGGDGGDGSAGPSAGPGASAADGGGGGGGGGGGAGIIIAPATAILGTSVSPEASP